MLLHYLAKRGKTKIAFFTQMPKFIQSRDFINLFDSRLILTLLYDSQNLVINAFSSGLLGAWFSRKEVDSAPAVSWRRKRKPEDSALVHCACNIAHNALVRCLLVFSFAK